MNNWSLLILKKSKLFSFLLLFNHFICANYEVYHNVWQQTPKGFVASWFVLYDVYIICYGKNAENMNKQMLLKSVL